jgi:flagellar hook-length control protein FliK
VKEDTMNPTHIVTTQLTTAANAASAANSASDAPADAKAALAFGLVLGEEIDAAALLNATDEKAPIETLPAEAVPAAAEPVPIDPAALGLPFALPEQSCAALPTPVLPAQADLPEADQAVDVLIASAQKKPADAQTELPQRADAPVALAKPEAKDAVPVIAAAAFEVAAPKAADAKAVVPGNESTQALAAIQSAQTSLARPAEAGPAVNLAQPVGSERWNTELGQTVNLLIRGDQTRASLHVTPPELGPIEIRINLSGDQASISFTVQQTDTRAALENALPRLREMLAESGINLGQSQVNHQAADQQQPQSGAERAQFGTADAGTPENTVQIRTRVGLVDTFA